MRFIWFEKFNFTFNSTFTYDRKKYCGKSEQPISDATAYLFSIFLYFFALPISYHIIENVHKKEDEPLTTKQREEKKRKQTHVCTDSQVCAPAALLCINANRYGQVFYFEN